MKRTITKNKKPAFIRQDSHKKKRLGNAWRRPKGLQSKLRLGWSGHRTKPGPGYRTQISLRGLYPNGLKGVLIDRISQLEEVDKKTEGIVIGHAVGQKNKVIIIKEALKQKITILNIKDPESYIKKIEDSYTQRKVQKEKSKKEKTDKKKELEKKSQEKDKETLEKTVEKTEEDKKEEEKKEKDKILTKREA